jgi:hypothetical protein
MTASFRSRGHNGKPPSKGDTTCGDAKKEDNSKDQFAAVMGEPGLAVYDDEQPNPNAAFAYAKAA